MNNNVIHSTRVIKAPIELVYQAFANPLHLKNWWGPNGFTNTFHAFNLKPGGNWMLTMHGPEKGNYENSSIFKSVIPNKFVSWKRISQPLFEMEIAFEKIADNKTEISFRMIFETVEACEKIRRFAEPNNEENFDRLEAEIQKM
jgi:uncharacterized protein YndB with AHSA1/START domain